MATYIREFMMMGRILRAAICEFDTIRSDASLGVIRSILQHELEELVLVNNILVDVGERRPVFPDGESPSTTNDEATIIDENRQLLAFMAECQPLYAELAERSANVAAAMETILKSEGWKQRTETAKLNSDTLNNQSDDEECQKGTCTN